MTPATTPFTTSILDDRLGGREARIDFHPSASAFWPSQRTTLPRLTM
jgi:hypothetical protein